MNGNKLIIQHIDTTAVLHVNVDDKGKIEIDITDDHDWVEQIGKTARYAMIQIAIVPHVTYFIF